MHKNKTYNIAFKGGIVSPGTLSTILSLAAEAGVKKVRLGLRQGMFIEVVHCKQSAFELACESNGLDVKEIPQATPGIMSAYPVIHFYQEDSWLSEGVYKDIFDQFEAVPSCKINITEQYQSCVPLFTGHINWITTDKPHYWHLALRLPKSEQILHWPQWIYTNNIASVSNTIQTILMDPKQEVEQSPGFLQLAISRQLSELNYIYIDADSREKTIPFYLPYYEGFNKLGNTYWLGIYRRDEYFDLEFLREVCSLCQLTKIAQIYTTPWKSLIIKEIDPANRHLWDSVLGKYRVNVRHAANELNWQIEDCCEEGLGIKRAVIRHFDKQDVRTYGLCFGVQTKPHSKLYASVLIKKKKVNNPARLKSLDRYDILHTTDFNPNTQSWVLYRSDVKKEFIGEYLVGLCKVFYNRSKELQAVSPGQFLTKEVAPEQVQKLLYQCEDCFGVYDPEIGDQGFNLKPGTPWDAVPSVYHCQVCGATKSAFRPIDSTTLCYVEM